MGCACMHPPHFLELCTESVFFGRYRSVFLGICHTDLENSVGHFGIKKGVIAPFFLKGGQCPPFRGAQPPFRKKGGNDTKKGGTIPT